MTTPRPGTAPTDRERDVLRAWVEADFDSASAAGRLGITDGAVRQASHKLGRCHFVSVAAASQPSLQAAAGVDAGARLDGPDVL